MPDYGTTRFTGDLSTCFAFTGAFRAFDRAHFFALGATDFACAFDVFFAARLMFKSATNVQLP
jgi:hypothetical protein